MTTPTFIPPIDPSPGTSDKPELRILKADFGDGYTQATRQLNNVRRVLTLKWDVLDLDDALAITDFMTKQGGCDPFYYKLPGDPAPLLWTCEEFDRTRATCEYSAVTATFRQSFNLVAS